MEERKFPKGNGRALARKEIKTNIVDAHIQKQPSHSCFMRLVLKKSSLRIFYRMFSILGSRNREEEAKLVPLVQSHIFQTAFFQRRPAFGVIRSFAKPLLKWYVFPLYYCSRGHLSSIRNLAGAGWRKVRFRETTLHPNP